MKYLKVTILVFIATLVFTTVSVLANSYTFTTVKVPALSVKKDIVEKVKDNKSDQTFQKAGCRDTLSGEERAVEVRTYSYNLDRVNYWVTVPKGQVVNISNTQHNTPGRYILQARTEANKITGCNFSGTWILD